VKTFVYVLAASFGLMQAAAADPKTDRPARRWAAAVQLDFSAGGDDLINDEIQLTETGLGDGITPSIGLIYRPMADSVFELQAWLGYKLDIIVPVRVGPNVGISRTVFQFLGNYRNNDKWYVGGGLVLHTGAKFEDDWPDAQDLNFGNAAGVMLEGGWNWVGLQCTYMEYKSEGFGKFDASNCGVRFTFRFPRWRPLN
jgi:hypothetical protein